MDRRGRLSGNSITQQGGGAVFFIPNMSDIILSTNSQLSFLLSFSYRWEDYPKMNLPRAWLGLEWVPDGRLFAVGGFGGEHQTTQK